MTSSTDPRNPELLRSLKLHMERAGLDPAKMRDRTVLAKRLDYKDGTQVYRYLTDDKWAGDLAKFETRLEAFLSNELRIDGGGELIDDPNSFILPSMFAFLHQVRKHGHIGVAHGHAGVGKTCACRLYAARHKDTTLYLHLYAWTRGRGALVRELLNATGLKAARGESKEATLARHFRDSGIMIILDNAMRLTRGGRDWLQDFLDFTGISIALVGNPEIITQWAAVDQHRRRVGLKRDVSIDLFDEDKQHNTSEATVLKLLARHLPEGANDKEVKRLAMQIIKEPHSGACGAVVMHATLAHQMLQGGRITAPAEAFKLATTQLIQEAA